MKHLDPKEAYEFLQANPEAVFIDVRSEMEHMFVGHPRGSILIPWVDGPDWEIDPHFVAHVRKAARPEFGFLDLRLAPNPLFRDLPESLVMASHFDEAFDLPGAFKVLAASPDCAVHAFQYRDLPVWGVQFHPEYGAEEGDRIWKEVFCHTPARIPPAPERPGRMDRNQLIFDNFARA